MVALSTLYVCLNLETMPSVNCESKQLTSVDNTKKRCKVVILIPFYKIYANTIIHVIKKHNIFNPYSDYNFFVFLFMLLFYVRIFV